MRFKHSIAVFGAAFVAYNIFKHRKTISETYRIEKERLEEMAEDKGNIQKQLTVLKSELNKLNTISQETQHQMRVFQKDVAPRLTIIKDNMKHLQDTLTKKSSTDS